MTHYGIWQFGFLGFILYEFARYLAELMKEHFEFTVFKLTDGIFTGISIFLCVAVWVIIVFLYLQYTIYSDKTNGRNYHADHGQYKRSWSELISYYSDADPYQIDKSTLPQENWREAEGIILGKVGKSLIKRPSDAVGNLSLFALPGGGKTTSQIAPSALRFAGSVLVIDIKGDILNATKDHRKKIKIFAPDNAAESCHFNPLYGIKSMTVTERRIFIEQIAYILVQDEKDGKYFTDGARDFFCGISLYLLNNDINTTFPDIVSAILHGNAIDWVMTIRSSQCSEAQEYTNSFYQTNEKNVAGVYQNLSKSVRPFSNGDLAKLLDGKGNCITPECLERGFDVYIKLPQDKISVYAPITTIIVQNFMTAFMQRPDSSSGKKLKPILFLLDEFEQLKFDFDTLMIGLSTLRSKRVSFFLAQQSIAQLSKRYGDDGCRQIIDTCGYISIMSAQDPKSREYFQKLIGTKKVLKVSNTENSKISSRTIQETREPIFQPEDFGNLDDKVVIIANGKYIKADKCKSYE